MPQSRDDEGYFWAVIEELKNQGFVPYVFSGEKKEMTHLLLSAPLTNEERLEFFDKLVAVPESEVPELKKGIEKDLKQI